MTQERFRRLACAAAAGSVVLSVAFTDVSSAQASTSAASAYNHALNDALQKKYVTVLGTATAAGFRGVSTSFSGPTIAEETTSVTYSGPHFKLVEIVVGKTLYVTGSAAALTDEFNFSATNAAHYENKPLLLPASNPLYLQSIDGATTPSGVDSIRMKGTVTEGKPLTYKGKLVNVFSGTSAGIPGSPSQPETVYVSTSKDPLPVLLKGRSNGLNITDSFVKWGVAFNVVAPLNAITIQPSWTKK